jgi:microcin C transport system substrate-binding protein
MTGRPHIGRRRFNLGLAAAAGGLAAWPRLAGAAPGVTRSHGLTLGDTLKYGPGFRHLEFVDPDAPKGGTLRLAGFGGFDSFNPFIIKGEPPDSIGLLFEGLTVSVNDDMLSQYGLVAGSVEVPDDLSWVVYTLRPEARFHDGTPVMPEDVIWSLNALREKGQPLYRFYYGNIARAEKTGTHGVKFIFRGARNRELPQIIGEIPVLSRAYWETRSFENTTLEPPLGSGPYRVADFQPPRFVVYERVADWWGRDLPVNRGRYNYDRIRIDFFRDQEVMLEAFKAHVYDFRAENSSKRWATQYEFPARRSGKVRVEAIPEARPVGMQCFAFNLRRAKFRDRALRWALNHAFDFEWTNRNLFYGQYKRNDSYFANTELAARALPSRDELALLEPWRGKVPDEAFATVYQPPATDGSGDNRSNLIKAQRMLLAAGYRIVGNRLIDPAGGRPVEIEFLLVSPDFERIVTPLIRNLRRLGVTGRVRVVDTAQYQNRVRDFDYDMIVASFGQSLSPGNEQRNYWSSGTADRPGSRNLIGIKDPAIDALVEAIIAAPDRASLIAATRALDRVLLWHHFVIPNWYIDKDRLAWWDRFGIPKVLPKYGVDLYAWWIDPEKDRALEAGETPR